MKTYIYSLTLVLTGLAICVGQMPAVAPAVPTGKVLLLDTEQILEGEIEKKEGRYYIRGATGETVLPGNRVLALVDSRKQAYEVLQKYANLRDPDERLRLARWCVLYNLRDEALAEANAVLHSDPENRGAGLILQALKRTEVVAQPERPAPKIQATKPDPVVEVNPENFNRESFGLFVTKVQPILMNTCIGCHSAGKGGSFQLIRPFQTGDRKATMHNLTMSLKALDRDRPALSPLLRKSVSPHGNAIAPPLRDQKLLAYENLEAWVSLALASDGATEGVSLKGSSSVSERKWEPKESTPVKKTGPVFGESSSSKPTAETKTEASDPFDPAIFNEEIKPKK